MDSGLNTGTQMASEPLSELSRATTAYHDAAPDGLETARQEYLEVLRRFNQSK